MRLCYTDITGCGRLSFSSAAVLFLHSVPTKGRGASKAAIGRFRQTRSPMKRKRRRKMGFQFLLSACAAAGAVSQRRRFNNAQTKRRARHHAPNACIGRKRRSAFGRCTYPGKYHAIDNVSSPIFLFDRAGCPVIRSRSPQAHSGRSQDRSLPEEVFRRSRRKSSPPPAEWGLLVYFVR